MIKGILIDFGGTIDSDGTHRYFDMQGRQLKSRPSKGVYIDNGHKIIK